MSQQPLEQKPPGRVGRAGRGTAKSSESLAVTILPAVMWIIQRYTGEDVPDTVVYSFMVFGGIVASRITQWIERLID